MEYQSKRRNKKSLISLIIAAVLAVGAGIVGFMPYRDSGYSVCDSALTSIFAGHSATHSFADFFSGGRCSAYSSQMTTIMVVLLVAAAIALIIGLKLRNRGNSAAATQLPAPAAAQYTHETPEAAAASLPVPPTHEPFAPAYPAATAAHPAGGLPYSQGATTQAVAPVRQFDFRLVVWGLGVIAGCVVVSVLVQLLTFLPGFLQVIVWAAIELTVIWQVLKYRAKGDPAKLAQAERWNPVGLAVAGLALAKTHLESTRPQAPSEPRADQHQPQP